MSLSSPAYVSCFIRSDRFKLKADDAYVRGKFGDAAILYGEALTVSNNKVLVLVLDRCSNENIASNEAKHEVVMRPVSSAAAAAAAAAARYLMQ